MKGKLKNKNGNWYIVYDEKELPCSPSSRDFISCLRGEREGREMSFTEVLINPIGREVDPMNLQQNHSSCKWFAKLV